MRAAPLALAMAAFSATFNLKIIITFESDPRVQEHALRPYIQPMWRTYNPCKRGSLKRGDGFSRHL